jgi:hypothetical protein
MFLYLNRWEFDHTLSAVSKPRLGAAQMRFATRDFSRLDASRRQAMQSSWMSTLARAALVTAAFAMSAQAQPQTAAAGASPLMYKGADRDQRVLEKAKQEGTVSVYNYLSPTDAKRIEAAFEYK